jgi:lambda repressor-like predicted transcriptional regulator
MAQPADFWRNLIAELIRERGMSVRAFSREIQISRTILRHYLDGKSRIPMDRLERMLAFFGYELDAFPRKVA